MELWLADPEAPGYAALADRCLAPSEEDRAARFTHARARAVYRGARALLRQTLSRYADVPPEAWRFAEGLHGKPAIAAPPAPLAFNVSHTASLAVVAVCGPAVPQPPDLGCDVEHTGRRGRLDAIARRFFAPAEVAAWQALAPEARRDRFFDLWTLKEAYAKARGLGLHLPTTSYAMDLDTPGEVALRPGPGADEPAPERWSFVLASAGADHRLALAVRAPLAAVRARRTRPDGAWSEVALAVRARRDGC